MRARNTIPAAALALLLGALGFGQTRTSIAPPLSAAAKKDGPSAPRKSDTEIEKAIRAKLAKSKIQTDHFNVHVRGGVATIEGTTNVSQHKGVATRFAESAGAIRVANNIQIRQAAHNQANANLAQGLKRAEIKHGDQRPDGSSKKQPVIAPAVGAAPIREPAAPKPNASVQAARDNANANAAPGLKRLQIKHPDAASQPTVGSTATTAQNR